MKAMILAAGLGTRLRPLTDNKPKALLEISGITLLERVVMRLKRFGYDEFIINVHHFADQIIGFVKSKDHFNARIEFSDERDMLLDTGGALLKASRFFNDGKPFLVHNVDILTDIDLDDLCRMHNNGKSWVTLAVRRRETSRYFLFDAGMKLCGWKNTKSGETIITRAIKEEPLSFAFSGVQIINPGIFSMIKETGKFSLTDLYLRLCGENEIIGYMHNYGFWTDVGKHEELKEAEQIIKSNTDK